MSYGYPKFPREYPFEGIHAYWHPFHPKSETSMITYALDPDLRCFIGRKDGSDKETRVFQDHEWLNSLICMEKMLTGEIELPHGVYKPVVIKGLTFWDRITFESRCLPCIKAYDLHLEYITGNEL